MDCLMVLKDPVYIVLFNQCFPIPRYEGWCFLSNTCSITRSRQDVTLMIDIYDDAFGFNNPDLYKPVKQILWYDLGFNQLILVCPIFKFCLLVVKEAAHDFRSSPSLQCIVHSVLQDNILSKGSNNHNTTITLPLGTNITYSDINSLTSHWSY